MKAKNNKITSIICAIIIFIFMVLTDAFTAISNWKLTLLCFTMVIIFGAILLYLIRKNTSSND